MLTIIPIIAVKIKHSHRNLTLKMKTNKVKLFQINLLSLKYKDHKRKFNKKYNIKKIFLVSKTISLNVILTIFKKIIAR
jgi:hypothetical protein